MNNLYYLNSLIKKLMSGMAHHNKLIQYQKKLGTLVEIINIILSRLNYRKKFKMTNCLFNFKMKISNNLKIPIGYNQ